MLCKCIIHTLYNANHCFKNKTLEGEKKITPFTMDWFSQANAGRQRAIKSPLALTDESVVPVSAVVTQTATFLVFCITL